MWSGGPDDEISLSAKYTGSVNNIRCSSDSAGTITLKRIVLAVVAVVVVLTDHHIP
jgi:hypothetical protein